MTKQPMAPVHTHQFWNDAAPTFDQEADHGLHDPRVRQAWRALLQPLLPVAPATCLDIGCGTGSLSLLLAELGHTVIGIDFAAAMIDRARQKAAAAGQVISFQEMAAANPQFPPAYFDLVLCRHLLWVLPEPKTVLQRWVALLKPAGRLLLVEGFWHTGGGLHQAEVVAALPTALTNVHVQDLSTQPALWGTNVDDERYLLTAECTDGD